MSKQWCFWMLLLPFGAFAQTCDTLYSHENYVERGVTINSRNCYWSYFDTTYSIVQWNNFDPVYQSAHFLQSGCFSLFHSQTGKLLEEGWVIGDTSFTKSYYASGNLKRMTESYRNSENPLDYFGNDEVYYENGELFQKGTYAHAAFNERTWYYRDGTIQAKGTYYDLYPSAWGEYAEYFPNGKLSSLRTYSMPDTTIRTFQQNELLSAAYYTIDGRKADADQNEMKSLLVSIYPPPKNEWSEITNGLYAWEHFSDQIPYRDELSDFKNRILQELKIPEYCPCKTGVFWFSVIVTKKGKIEIHEIEIADPELKQSVETALRKIKRWPPGLVDGRKVDTFVYTYLVIDFN